MRYSVGGGSGGWKAPQPAKNEVCYWTINAEIWKWQTAEIAVTFTKIEPGINLALWANDGESTADVTSATLIKPLTLDGEIPTVDTVYKIDAKKYNFTIIAVPTEGSATTALEFTFKVEGQEYVYW